MSNKLKACIVIDALTIRRGGGLVLLQNIASALSQNESISLHVLCNPATELPELEGNDRVGISRAPRTEGALGAFLYRQRKLDTYLDDLDGNCTLIAFNAWSKSKHKQITIHINTIPFLPFQQRVNSVGYLRALLLKSSSQKALKNSCLNLFESQYLLDTAKLSYRGEIREPKVRHFGSDLRREPFAELPPLKQRRQQLVTVTSGAKHKQNHKVLEAFGSIKRKYPELELLIVGNEQLIRNDIAEFRNEATYNTDGIKYAGYLSRDELAEQLKYSLALISLSSTESFYLVAIEAMFCGTPVIAKRIASAEESCGEHAVLLDDDSAQAVFLAFKNISQEDNWKERSKSAHEYSKRFSAERCLCKIRSDIIKVALGNPP